MFIVQVRVARVVMRVVSVLASGRCGGLGINIQSKLELELELILIQPRMAQKPMPNTQNKEINAGFHVPLPFLLSACEIARALVTWPCWLLMLLIG